MWQDAGPTSLGGCFTLSLEETNRSNKGVWLPERQVSETSSNQTPRNQRRQNWLSSIVLLEPKVDTA